MLESVEWGEFLIGDLFEFHTSKKRFDANKVQVLEAGKYPYVVRTALNNGIKGFIDELPEFLNDGNTISFGQDTATMFYQKKPYFTGDKIKIMKAKFEKFNGRNAQFILPVMSKAFSLFSWGSSSFKVSELKNVKCQLPIQNGNLHLDFMENFVAELEARRTAELEAYLSAAGLKDYTLTAEEERALAGLRNIRWAEFKIGNLFEKLDLRFLKSQFNKNSDVFRERSNEFNLPLVNAKDGENGVMYYGRLSDFENAEMTIDIVKNGAVATGNVYPQPQLAGVHPYNDAYLIRHKGYVDREQLFFFAASIYKSIKQKFSYEFKANWERVQKEYIWLPVNIDGKPDYAYMQTLIAAIQKLVIKDVVRYADEKIAATKTITGQMA